MCVHSQVRLFVATMNCSLPGSCVHGILQARTLAVGCHFLLQGILPNQVWNKHLLCLLHCRQNFFFFFFFLTTESPGKPYSKHSVSYSLKLKAIKRPLQLEAEQYETEELRFWSLTPWIPK